MTEARSWMAFAVQKVGELATLATGLADGREALVISSTPTIALSTAAAIRIELAPLDVVLGSRP